MGSSSPSAPALDAGLGARDRVLDTVKAFALLVVVVVHRLEWDASAGSPASILDRRPALAWVTWTLQVLPLFFAAGAVTNAVSWHRDHDITAYLRRRLVRLATPAWSTRPRGPCPASPHHGGFKGWPGGGQRPHPPSLRGYRVDRGCRRRVTLLWLESSGEGVELAEDLAGDVALEAASDLASCSALRGAAFDVGAGGGVVGHADSGDDVQGAVELAVAAA